MQEALLYILTFFSPRLQPYVKMFNYENGAVYTNDNYAGGGGVIVQRTAQENKTRKKH